MSKLRMVKRQPLFVTPLLVFHVEGCEDLNKRLLVDIQKWRAESSGIATSNRLGWHSERTFFGRQEPSFQELNKLICRSLAAALEHGNPKLDISHTQMMMKGWVNVNEKGAFNTPHDHPDFLWSGCYYAQVPGAGAARSIDRKSTRLNS